MIFSYNWLQSFFKEKLPVPKKLAEILTLHSFEVEDVEKRSSDWILDIDILPNRAGDCLSHLGVAKEISALLGYKILNPKSQAPNKSKIQNSKSKTKDSNAKDFVSVEVKDKTICPRYCARVITDVKVGPSPKWLRERLKICGLNSINNVVDATNYVMLEMGQPLHAFDFFKVESAQNQKSKIKNQNDISKIKNIIIRKARKKEKIISLDNEKYDLDEDILVIADIKEPLAIAGIKGGKKAEIDKNTKTIVLESANFDRLTIYRTEKKIKLETESSKRFKQGIDLNLTEIAINRVAQLIKEIAGGQIINGMIDIYPKKILPKILKLDLDYVESLLGIKISVQEIKNILKRLSFECSEIGAHSIEVAVSTFRRDINIQEDLIEEIGRIYGYEKISAKFPQSILISPKRNLEVFWEDMAKNILKEAGFSEVYNYSFISDRQAEIFSTRLNLVELENPISVEQRYLRPSLIPNLLKNVVKNQTNFKEIKIFELGKIFYKCKMQNAKCKIINQNVKILEKKALTGVLVKDGEGFYQMKGIMDLLFQKLGISNIWYDSYQTIPEESKISIWHPNKRAEIKINKETIGFLGEISKKILKELKIEAKIIVFDIDFEKLSQLASEEQEYRPISKYPAAIRDLAVLIPQATKAGELLKKISAIGGKLIRDVDLFDLYQGKELPEGKKSLAFHIIYQAEDRTLNSQEIDKIHQKIIKGLEEEKEWEVRR